MIIYIYILSYAIICITYIWVLKPHEPTIQCVSSLRCLRSFAVVLSACHSVAAQLLKPTQMLPSLRRQALSVLGDFYNKQQESFVQQDASPKEPEKNLFVASNSYPAPQLKWFDANKNVVGPKRHSALVSIY